MQTNYISFTMDCRDELEFNDDSSKRMEKANESILLMKKKMFRSHDLILQYNNKLKECDRLKGDLSIVQEEAAKFKQDNNTNLSKVLRLEMQSTDIKKKNKELEEKIDEQNIRIASDKCHVEQLICKLKDVEDQHSIKLMEIDLQKASLEEKVKELEQELKALKKSHLAEIKKLEKANLGLQKSPKLKQAVPRIKPIENIPVETQEIGVNTIEEPVPEKPLTLEKSTLTNDFYHIKDNPYPIFCDKCESLMHPSVDKICRIMTNHPILLSEMLSPPRPCVSERILDFNKSNCEKSRRIGLNLNDPHSVDMYRDISNHVHQIREEVNYDNVNDTDDINHIKLNRNKLKQTDLRHVETISQNLTAASIVHKNVLENCSSAVIVTTPEIMELKRQLATLERKVKKQSRKKALESQQQNSGFCNHSHTLNCCGHGVNHVNTKPNIFPNVQPDSMSDFFSKMMKFVKERTPKRESTRKRNKRCKIKSQKLKKRKMTSSKKQTKHCGSSDWEIKSNDCQPKANLHENLGNSSTDERHILRIIRSENVDIRLADMSLNNSEKLSLDEVPQETSISENSERLSNRRDEIIEEVNVSKSVANMESLTNVSSQPITRRGKKKRERIEYSFSEDDSTGIESRHDQNVAETNPVQALRRTSSRIQNRCLRNRESARKRLATEESIPSCPTTNLKKLESDISKPVTKLMSVSPDVEFEEPKSRHSKIKSISESPSGSVKNFVSLEGTSVQHASTASTNSKDCEASKNIEIDNLSRNLPINTSTFSHSTLKNLESENQSGNLPISKSILVSSNTDMKNTELESSAQHLTIDKSDANSSDENLTDGLPENDLSQSQSDLEPTEQEILEEQLNTKKRKRGRPRVTKQSSRSKLFGKLRALRKNSVLTVRSIVTNKTNTEINSLSKRKDSNTSEVEEPKDESKKNDCSLSGSESDCHIPAKKQRIAHVPKIIADVKLTDDQKVANKEQENVVNEICAKDSNVKLEVNCGIEAQQRPVTRRSAIDKSKVNNALNGEKMNNNTGSYSGSATIESINYSSRRLPISVTEICRKVRAPPRRNLSGNSSLVLNSTPKTNNSTTTSADSGRSWLSSPKQKVASLEASPITSCLGLSLPQFTPDSSMLESPDVEKSSVVISQSPEIKLKECNIILERSDSSEDSKTNEITAESPITSKIQRKFISVDFVKSADVLDLEITNADASSADENPLDALESIKNQEQSLKVILGKSVETSDLRNINDSDRNENKSKASTKRLNKIVQLNRNSYKRQNTANSMEISGQFNNSEDSAFPADAIISPTSGFSGKIVKESTENIVSPNHSQSSLPHDLLLSESSDSPDAASAHSITGPASPDSSPGLPGVINFMPESETFKPPLSIYDNVTIDLPDEASTALQTASNSSPQSENSQRDNSIDDKFSTHITPVTTADKFAIEPAIGRKSLVYDTSLLESSFEEGDQDFEEPKSQRNCEEILNRSKEYIVKKLRTRQVLTSPVEIIDQSSGIEKLNTAKKEKVKAKASKDPGAYQRGIRDLRTLFNRHIAEEKKTVKSIAKNRIPGAIALQAKDEETVKTALENLVDSDEWTSNLHQSVIETLRGISSPRTIAKAIVDFLTESADLQEPFDRTYTPPAPVMTKTQQRIITLINSLDQDDIVNDIFELVQAGIEYNIFKLGCNPEMEVVEYLIRMYAVMARIKKDRERLRILCCDVLYRFNRLAPLLIHTILTIWLEVFPMYDSNSGELPIYLSHLLRMKQNPDSAVPKSASLNRMLSDYYRYPQIQKSSADLIKILLQTLKNNYTIDIETAVLLIAKHEGNDWAYKNIIDGGLMQMITDNSFQSNFNALNLLGFILRSFPIGDAMVAKMTSQLCNMIDSGEGSPDHQEGVASALLSLSRHNVHFKQIQNSLLKWKPSQTLRAMTIEKLKVFFKVRSTPWRKQNLKNDISEKGTS